MRFNSLIDIEKYIRKHYGKAIYFYYTELIKIWIFCAIFPYVFSFTCFIWFVVLYPTPDLNRKLTMRFWEEIELQWQCDTPLEWQTYLHDPASISMEGILMFNKHLLFLVIVIVMFVGWILTFTVYYFVEYHNKYSSKFVHSKELEIVWTSIPALILLLLATPSFTLLYAMDELTEPELSLKVLGHQWFWSYEISDFNSCQKSEQNLKYVCYMMVIDGLPRNKYGYFRLLETNKRVILPTNTHLRLLVSAADVLHSWTIPSFGLKVDACPGRLNQVNLFIKRIGVFFGQCSEICGVNHGFMPIVIVALPTLQFHTYIMSKLELSQN